MAGAVRRFEAEDSAVGSDSVERRGGVLLMNFSAPAAFVLFGADGALMFLDDFGGDGQAEAGAALLGGEVGRRKRRFGACRR